MYDLTCRYCLCLKMRLKGDPLLPVLLGLICDIFSNAKRDLGGICAPGLPGILWDACGGNIIFLRWHVYMEQVGNKIKHGSVTGLPSSSVYRKI